MTDGANMGISAKRALDTILGGDPQPTEQEQSSPGRTAVRVMLAPTPLEGPGPWERADAGEIDRDAAYSLAADCIAKAFLICEHHDPGLLERDTLYGPENTDIEDLWGKSAGLDHAPSEAAKERFPGLDDWVGGASGFQVGFALNTARYVMGAPPAQNPAIITLDIA